MLVVSCVRLFLTLWTVACQTLFSMDYFQAKILEWIAISFSRDLPNPGIEHTSPVLAGGFFTTGPQIQLYEDSNTAWWLSGKESACKTGDTGSIPGSGRFSWRRKWQPTPVFLPRESYGQRSLGGYNPLDFKGVGQNLATKQQLSQ